MKDDSSVEKFYDLIDTIYTQAINYPALEWVLITIPIFIALCYRFFWTRPKQKKEKEKQDEDLKNIQKTLQQYNTNTQLSVEEQQASDKSIEALITSHNPNTNKVIGYLIDGNINSLKAFDKENANVETKLWLATIFDYTDPSQAEHYLE